MLASSSFRRRLAVTLDIVQMFHVLSKPKALKLFVPNEKFVGDYDSDTKLPQIVILNSENYSLYGIEMYLLRIWNVA